MPRLGIPADLVVPVPNVVAADDLVASILSAPEYEEAVALFADHPFWQDSIFSYRGLALLYALVRNRRPATVVEIGTFQGQTAFAFAHALQANGAGHLHTVGPFDRRHFLPLFSRWPTPLRRRTTFHNVNSAAFFGSAAPNVPTTYDLVFVDGDHDYEFALFDIQCAARRIKPGGFIAIDNIGQAGPMRATIEFLRNNPDWRDCGSPPIKTAIQEPFSSGRSNVRGTDLALLQAPAQLIVRGWPRSFGAIPWKRPIVHGVDTNSDDPVAAQCVLRSFGQRMTEAAASVGGSGRLIFSEPLICQPNRSYSVEIWITAESGSAILRGRPVPF